MDSSPTGTQVTGNLSLSRRAQLSAEQPIGELMATAIANPHLVSLAAGFVDQETLPHSLVKDAFHSVFAEEGTAKAALQYGATHGDRELRELILERLRGQDEKPYQDLDADRVVLSAGSNQMLHLLADALFNEGDIIICAAPTYLVFLGILEGIGARSYGVETDEHGMIPESIDKALEHFSQRGELDRVKAIYLVSYFDNPMGISTTPERRRAIVELAQNWSRDHRIHVLEDAAYRELRYKCDDVVSTRAYDDAGQTVIHTGSFSKSFSPGVRIGWGVLPADLVEPICNLKGNIDFGSPHLNQRVMSRVFHSGEYDRHIERLRSNYSEKMDAMLNACDRHFSNIDGMQWVHPDGGLYVWTTFPKTLHCGPQEPLFKAAVEEGVLYVPGHYCFPKEGAPVQANTARLSFGVQSAAGIARGIELLAKAIRRVM